MKIPSVTLTDIDSLTTDGKNPNKLTQAQEEALKKNIEKYGFLVPVITNKKLLIADGEHRWKAARAVGMKQIPVIALDVDEVDRRTIRQVMNKLKGTHDFELDSLEYQFLLEHDAADQLLELIGNEDKKLVQFIASAEKNLAEDQTPSPDKPKYPVQTGELYQLGEHTLMCGDSTKKTDVDALMRGGKADMVFTDPPYGINAVSHDKVGVSGPTGFNKRGSIAGKGLEKLGFKNKGSIVGKGLGIVKAGVYPKIIGDDKPFDPKHLLTLADKLFLFGANNYASKLPDASHWLVWDKKCEKAADRNFFSDVELIYTNIPRKSCVIYRHLWSGLLREGDRNVESKNRLHPTQKPVGLLIDILSDYSNPEDTILDPYGGSGSTLIACEQLNRKCYMLEIDPLYCSVIIERWENLTGKKHEKVT